MKFFKAVIDARTLLAHVLITPTLGPHNPFYSATAGMEVSKKINTAHSMKIFYLYLCF
jgi:hypothetical protein